MTWITRCPACRLTYTVFPDQLRVAQGWLRCGQCQQAFDSTGLVLKWTPEAIHTAPASTVVDNTPERLDIEDLLKQEDRTALHPPVSAFEEALASFKPQPLTPSPTTPKGEFLGVPLGDLSVSHAPPENQAPVWSAKTSPAWAKALLGFLLLALVLQWIAVGRYRLVAAEPSLAQPLAVVCRLLGCEMVPAAVRGGVVIESSSMTPRDGALALLWSVRNVSPQTLEMPALELTWLDAQDKALVRRVLLPIEQNAPFALAPGQVWHGQLHLLPAQGLQPVGYRLVNFHP